MRLRADDAIRDRCAPKVTIVLLIRVQESGVETKRRACFRAGPWRL